MRNNVTEHKTTEEVLHHRIKELSEMLERCLGTIDMECDDQEFVDEIKSVLNNPISEQLEAMRIVQKSVVGLAKDLKKIDRSDKIKILAKVSGHYEDLLTGIFTRNAEPVFTVKEAAKAMEIYAQQELKEMLNGMAK